MSQYFHEWHLKLPGTEGSVSHLVDRCASSILTIRLEGTINKYHEDTPSPSCLMSRLLEQLYVNKQV